MASSHEERKARLIDELAAGAGALGLRKDTSNLFRNREEGKKRRLDVRPFHHVLEVNPREGWADVEGMTTYEDLVAATLPHAVMPAVVPQLKTITIGGAAAGVGIEASSFRYGLVHETLLEMEILTAAGEIVLARPDNEHRDLYFGFPNSYGSLGYALRLKVMTLPILPFVQAEHVRCGDARTFFRELAETCRGDAHFVDGVVFAPDELYLTVGRFTREAPFTSDYTYENIYYRSIRDKRVDFLTTSGYIWRWDTDWFWCSDNFHAQNPLIRRMLGRHRLNSRTYTQIMRWNSRWRVTDLLDRLSGWRREPVIQDVDIPLERAPAFLDFFHREIGILPIWVCPFRAYDPNVRYDLYPVSPDRLYVNFGFWDVVRRREAFPPGHFNRLVEREVARLDGIKSLYSDSYYDPDMFWSIYDRGGAYRRLKAKYDPEGILGDLYDKCVLRR